MQSNLGVNILSAFAGALVAVAIGGCGSDQRTTAPQEQAAVGETAPEPGQAVVGETTPLGPRPTEVAGPPAAPAGPPAEPRTRAAERPCPMQVEGTSVEVTDIEGGAALTFVNTDDVPDLRRRVEQMAQMHEQRHGAARGRGMEQQGGMGMGHVAVQTRVEPIEGGARLIILAEDPKEIAQVQQHARMMAGHMEAGECPMMQGQGMMRGQDSP